MEERVDSGAGAEGRTLGGCIVWLSWVLGGNLVLLTLLIFLMREHPWTLTVKDVLFWGVVATVLVLRYIDLTRLGGQKIDGSPAPPGLYRAYALQFIGVWLALWVVAHSVQLLP